VQALQGQLELNQVSGLNEAESVPVVGQLLLVTSPLVCALQLLFVGRQLLHSHHLVEDEPIIFQLRPLEPFSLGSCRRVLLNLQSFRSDL